MNNPIRVFDQAAGEVLTMSSREIAELCEKRHDHVMRDIRDMLAQLYSEACALTFGGTSDVMMPNGGTRRSPCYHLPYRETLILVSGYRLDLRTRIIDRWQELEEKARGAATLPDFTDPAAAARAWADEVERRQALESEYREQSHQIEEMRAAQAALDRISEADGSLCVTDAAKALQMRPKDLFSWLRSNGWIYRRPGSTADIGYPSKTAAGLLEHKVTTIYRSDGSERITEQVRVTPKGLSRLAVLAEPGGVS